ncbi:restriction modification system S chain-like protein [Rhizobium wenxiniae]|uniref:Type I restriction enzyme S subunit n=1 Tax=Rhizobium wenxiniae TaxID=1737357 RepID=A0A7X0D2F0_9HYPH|nr:restriction endonuclease subunit S [Rhizobium wenxiniae]MBB6165429.1 type I restriction enzyme S subunit [Rhizobium wenxiniae]GGG15424.1 restriction modification system S chain-like protein [Rhizobium wenxiniae]
MSREVPSGWKLAKLYELATMKAGGTPARDKIQYYNGDIPWLKSGEINRGRIWATEETITEKGLAESSAKLIPAGTPVVAMYGATAGVVGFLEIEAAINQAVLAVQPTGGLLDAGFCLHMLSYKAVDLLSLTQGSGQPNLSKALIENLEVSLPPLHEQRRIAEILSSVDEAIAATRAVIEQTRKVKQASLGALFHRGNWTDEELPAGHRLTSLEDIARRGSGHTPSKKFSEYWNGGVAWVSLQDTKALDRRHVNNTAANISDLGVKNSSAEVHPAGTVFVSRDATVGKVGIMQNPMAVSQHFIAWTCGPRLDNLFLYYWLLNMKLVFERIAAGSTIKTIGLGFFKELQIALPDMAIQKRIASQMMAIDDALDQSEASLDELKALKSALMSDLLTGRKRVTDALPLAAE